MLDPRNKLILTVLLPACVASAAVFFLLVRTDNQQRVNALTRLIEGSAEQIALSSTRIQLAELRPYLDQLTKIHLANSYVSRVRILDDKGRSILDIGSIETFEESLLQAGTIRIDEIIQSTSTITDESGRTLGWVIVQADLAAINLAFYQILLWGALVLVSSLCLAPYLVIRISRQMAKPIKELTRVVDAANRDDYSRALPYSTDEDLNRLARSIRPLIESLRDARIDLANNVEQATQDLQETPDTVETQHIELDKTKQTPAEHGRTKTELLRRTHPARTSQEITPGTSESTSVEELDYSSCQLLAVDDNEANLKLVCAILNDLGAQVTGVTTGLQALNMSSSKYFDLIFMDLQMPGLDGIETTRRIHALEDNHTPVVALTAHAVPSEIKSLLDAGMVDYVVKPISQTRIKDVLNKWVRRRARKPTQPAVQERQLPIVDWAVSLQLANNNSDLAEEMHQILLETLPKDRDQINAAHEREDMDLLRQNVHRLNGAVRYCGVPRLRRAIDALETIVKTDNKREIRGAINLLDKEVDSVLESASGTVQSNPKRITFPNEPR